MELSTFIVFHNIFYVIRNDHFWVFTIFWCWCFATVCTRLLKTSRRVPMKAAVPEYCSSVTTFHAFISNDADFSRCYLSKTVLILVLCAVCFDLCCLYSLWSARFDIESLWILPEHFVHLCPARICRVDTWNFSLHSSVVTLARNNGSLQTALMKRW